MARHWRRVGAVTLLAGLVAGVLAALPTAASAAAPSFGAPVTVVSAGCNFEDVTGDSTLSSDGLTRGFVAFQGGSCADEPAIRYFRQSGAGWTAVTSPYHGRVLAVAGDGIATWLLYADGAGIHLGQRTAGGTFAASHQLSPNGLGGAAFPTGDVVASAGKYWAVWTEQVGPGGEFAQQDLFQALTLGQGHFHDGIARQQITNTPSDDDIEPSLTLDPAAAGSAGRVVMVWTRTDGAQGLRSRLRTASAAFDGHWTSRQWTANATFAGGADLHTIFSSKVIVAAYVANGRIVQATGAPATVATNRFGTGFGPRATRSLGANFTAWTNGSEHLALAKSGGAGSISFQVDLNPGAGAQRLIGISASGGKATVLGASFTSDRLYSIRQR
jgi:hypothetical protein